MSKKALERRDSLARKTPIFSVQFHRRQFCRKHAAAVPGNRPEILESGLLLFFRLRTRSFYARKDFTGLP